MAGLALSAKAAPPPPVPLQQEAPWRIANFAKDAGLERRRILDLAFETNNIAWFATSDGLYRFDGYHWQRFTSANGLPSTFIRAVSVTRDGSVWVGTDQGAGVLTQTGFDRRGTEGRLAGPNVRRIVETADGAIWFCCDRWPDATQSGGLTRLRDGKFQSYGLADGLPSDHILTLFEQSNGRLIAMTLSGAAVWNQQRWLPMSETDPGFPPRSRTWAMHETPDGRVFAQTASATLMLVDGRWSPTTQSRGQANGPLCVTSEGALIKAVQGLGDAVWFARWNGDSFVRASAQIVDPGCQIESLRQAPDQAIWAVGRGTLLRWEYTPGMWEWHPELPPPVLEDHFHHVWFAGASGTVVETNGGFRPIPGIYPPLIEGAPGVVWAAGKTGVMQWTEDRLEPVPCESCGIAKLLGGTVDARGVVWLFGEDSKAGPVLAGWRSGKWQSFGSAALGGRRVLSAAADPQQGLWALLIDETAMNYDLVRVTESGVAAVTIEGSKPNTYRPSLCASPTHLYLYAYNGLWEAPFAERLKFTPVQAQGGRVFTHAISDAHVSAFVAQEGPDGRAAILLHRQDEWLRYPVAYGEGLWLNRDGWLTAADGTEFLLCQTRAWSTFTHVSLPRTTTINSMLRAVRGDFWLGTPQGVLHLQPAALTPKTLLSGPKTLREGAAGVFQAEGLAPFTPRELKQRFSFAWRLNSEAWSGYDDWPAHGLMLSNLPPAKYVLQARARDGFGNEDEAPASLAFEVQPLPLQDRIWFRPTLAAIGLTFAFLSLALYYAGSRLRRYATGLEAEVEARTLDLQRDVRERRRAEDAEREARRLLRDVLDTVPVRVFWKDMTGRYLGCNLAVAKAAGLASPEDIVGKTDFDLPWKDQAPAYQKIDLEVIRSGVPQLDLETTQTALGGKSILIRGSKAPLRTADGKIIGVLGTFEDITEQKRMEQEHEKLQGQLAQAQRIESVGRLAGGVAHDFNNMLQAILGNVYLAITGLPPDSPEHDNLAEIQKAAERSAALTRQLLAFARKQTIEPKVLDLNDMVNGMLKMLGRLIGEHIDLAWRPGVDLWPVRVDPSQIDQILANLCVNARDAIRGSGQVTLETRNVSLDPPAAASLPELAPGDYVLLSVTDNGCGMDAETQAQIFEPFFTTKSDGHGTGLGLATVYGIVKQNGGGIFVESRVGQGTVFRIYLPRHLERPEASAEPGAAPPTQGGTETVLIAEDEPTVLRLCEQSLTRLGYSVLAADTPSRAIQLAQLLTGTPIHLLVTDVIMPGMNGRELAQQLSAMHPKLKVLFMSGYTADVIAHHGALDEGIHFIQKPFTVHNFATKVRAVLDAR